jgi:hypothetical protein
VARNGDARVALIGFPSGTRFGEFATILDANRSMEGFLRRDLCVELWTSPQSAVDFTQTTWPPSLSWNATQLARAACLASSRQPTLRLRALNLRRSRGKNQGIVQQG